MNRIALLQEPNVEWIEHMPMRVAARGIILRNHQCLMVHSSFYDDYVFPGGGVEMHESIEEALKREVLEEVGVVVSSLELLGHVDEVRASKIRASSTFQQRSFFFRCEGLIKQLPKLEAYEQSFGFKGVWIEPKLALEHNIVRNNTRKNNTFLQREILLLEKIIRGEIT